MNTQDIDPDNLPLFQLPESFLNKMFDLTGRVSVVSGAARGRPGDGRGAAGEAAWEGKVWFR